MPKTAAQLDADIDEALEAEALRDATAARAARLARHTAAPASTGNAYDDKLRHWNDYAKRWGMAKALDAATSAVAGGVLGREFGESAESFEKRSPAYRATCEWLRAARKAAL